MAATFELELVSPEKLLLSRPVEMVTIPAVEGDMGILPGHSPMIVAMQGGIIRVRENGADTERLFVAGGFAEITQNRVTVLADEATPVAGLSRAAAEARFAEAEAAFNAAATGDELAQDRAAQRLQAARAMREAAPGA